MYVCFGVTCHLHFGQNNWGLLHATAVTRGWNGQQETVSTLPQFWCKWGQWCLGFKETVYHHGGSGWLTHSARHAFKRHGRIPQGFLLPLGPGQNHYSLITGSVWQKHVVFVYIYAFTHDHGIKKINSLIYYTRDVSSETKTTKRSFTDHSHPFSLVQFGIRPYMFFSFLSFFFFFFEVEIS